MHEDHVSACAASDVFQGRLSSSTEGSGLRGEAHIILAIVMEQAHVPNSAANGQHDDAAHTPGWA